MKSRLFLGIVVIVAAISAASAQTQPEVFNVNVYEGIYPDLFNAYGSNTSGATNHWLKQGLPVEGRRASFIFDVKYYIANNPGVPSSYTAALQDFMSNGLPAGKRGSLEFDVKYYLANNSDLAAAFGTNYLAAADHFLNQGLPCEGRKGSADFAVQDYINMYPDVAAGYPRTLSCASGSTDYSQAMMHWLRRGKAFGRAGVGHAPANECWGTQNPAYQYIYFTHRTDGSPGDGSRGNPFDASLTNDAFLDIRLDDILRHISEQTPGLVPINQATQNPYGPYNLVVCLDSGTFQTRGNWDWLINQGHTKGTPDGNQKSEPGGFTLNRNWHSHGAGVWATTVQLYDYVLDFQGYPPTSDYPNTQSGLGMVFATHDDKVGNIEISDLAIDGNYANLKHKNQSAVLNLHAVYLRGDVGGNNVHNINTINLAGEIGGVNIKWEAFPIWIVSDSGTNKIPEQAPNNQIKYVLMSNFAPGPGACTAITVTNVVAEVAFNVVNGWYSPTNQFGACQAYGGWSLSNAWFHDNISLNAVNGFLTDSTTNRSLTIEFNTFNNVNVQGSSPGVGIVVGGGGKYDYYTIQYNTVQMSENGNVGIILQGDVHGASILHNNILSSTSGSGIVFKQGTTNNLGNNIEYNQISNTLSNPAVASGNCVFDNWDQFSNPSSLTNTQGSACSTPAQAYATLQTDGNFVVYGAGAALWATNTYGTNAVALKMQDDGVLALYQEIWQAGTYRAPSGAVYARDGCWIGDTLVAQNAAGNPGQIHEGQCLESSSNSTFAVMVQGDLQIYDRQLAQLTWDSGTYGDTGASATLNVDGNFIVCFTCTPWYYAQPLWQSGTSGSGAWVITLENDGRLILYKPVFDTGPLLGQFDPTQYSHPQSSECTDVGPGTGWTGVIGPTSCFVSPNGRYKLYVQADGRMVVYDRSQNPQLPLWTNN